ncbi:MAG: AAA family ATPase [Propionibacteriales bacterium]|nr:AAA family ATPase [Propionibacteriales bacterium]
MSAESRPLLVLVGPPGTGKTSVGRVLAERLGVDLRDTDADIEGRAGKPISEIFVDEGEPHFRALERKAVDDALRNHEGVLSLGGGAVVDPATRELLGDHQVVFLSVGLSEAVRRVGLGVSRPLLLGNVRGRLKALMDERDPLYREVATAVVDTDDRTPDEIADEVTKVAGL